MRQLGCEGGLASGYFPFPRGRLANLYRRLFPGRGGLFFCQVFTLRRYVSLRRYLVMTGRDVRVLLVVLQGSCVRGTTAFIATPHCRFQINEQRRRREGGSSIVQRTQVFFLVAFRLFFQPALRSTVGLFKYSIRYLVRPLGGGGILFVAGVLQVSQVSYAFAGERGMSHVRRVNFSRPILPRGTVRFDQGVRFCLLRILVIRCECALRCRIYALDLIAGMREFSKF